MRYPIASADEEGGGKRRAITHNSDISDTDSRMSTRKFRNSDYLAR